MSAAGPFGGMARTSGGGCVAWSGTGAGVRENGVTFRRSHECETNLLRGRAGTAERRSDPQHVGGRVDAPGTATVRVVGGGAPGDTPAIGS